jgi:hypothetical protein
MNVVKNSAVSLNAENSIEGLIESIKKHKNFKQLASYSVKSLNKFVAPPRVGWEYSAKQAFALGAVDEVAFVAERFCTDPEVFMQSFSILSAISTVPRAVASMVAIPKNVNDGMTTTSVITLLIRAISGHFESLDLSRATLIDPCGVERLVGYPIRLLLLFCRHDPAAFEAAGGFTLLLDISSVASTSRKQILPPQSYVVVSPLIATAASVLDRATRSRSGLDALFKSSSAAEYVKRILELVVTNLNVCEASQALDSQMANRRLSLKRQLTVTRPKSFRKSPAPGGTPVTIGLLSLGSPSSAGIGGVVIASGNDLNAHLESSLRILDRIARLDYARDVLLASGATEGLGNILTLLSSQSTSSSSSTTIIKSEGGLNSPVKPLVSTSGNSTDKTYLVESLVMRVLARLIGSDMTSLMDRLTGSFDGGIVLIRDRILAARLLSSLAKDESGCDALLRNDADLCSRVLTLINDESLTGTPAVPHLLALLKNVASSGMNGITALDALNACAIVSYCMSNSIEDANVVSFAVAFLCQMAQSDLPGMPATLRTLMVDVASAQTGEGQRSPLWLSVCALALCIKSVEASHSCLQLVNLMLIKQGCDRVDMIALGVIPSAAMAMSLHKDNLALQLLVSDTLRHLIGRNDNDRSTQADEIVRHGVFAYVIENLGGASSARSASQTISAQSLGQISELEDEDDGLLGGKGNDINKASDVSLNLVASSMALVTKICRAAPQHVKSAKDAGIIKAVLSGFRRYNHDGSVYRRFREVINALRIEPDDIIKSINIVADNVANLQTLASAHDADSMRFVTDYVLRHMPSEHGQVVGLSLTEHSEQILEAVALIEAVTVSPSLACVVVQNNGLCVLVRTLGVLSVVKLSDTRTKAASNVLADRTISYALADEVLSRTCSTLSQLARVAYELTAQKRVSESNNLNDGMDIDENDEVGDDEAMLEGVDRAVIRGFEKELYARDTISVICRAISNSAKPLLHAFGSDFENLLSWLSTGRSVALSRERVDTNVQLGSIEACVSMMRAHQSSFEIIRSISLVLERIAGHAKGALAIAQRGASRHLIRMLRPSADLCSLDGDRQLISFLHVLNWCAYHNDREVKELFLKQNLVDALVECIDAGGSFDFFLDVEHDTAKKGVQGQGGGGRHKLVTDPTTLASDDNNTVIASSSSQQQNQHQHYITDKKTRLEIDEAATSILSMLVGPDTVTDTVYALESAAKSLTATFISKPRVPFAGIIHPRSNASLGLVREIIRLGLLAGTVLITQTGTAIFEAGSSACVKIASCALQVARDFEAKGAEPPTVGSIEYELVYALPAAIKTIRFIHMALVRESPQTTSDTFNSNAALEAVPMLTSTLEERPEHGRIVLKCLAELTYENEETSAAIPNASDGRGVSLLVDALKSAADGSAESGTSRGGDEEILTNTGRLITSSSSSGSSVAAGSKTTLSQKKVRDAMSTLANVASLMDCLQVCIDAGAHTAALNILTESAADANEELSEANLTLLAKMAVNPIVVKELIDGSIFELIGATLTHHCSSSDSPCEPVLHAAASLLTLLCGKESSTAVLELRAQLCAIVVASPVYCDSAKCMVTVLEMMRRACDSTVTESETVANENRESLLAAGAEQLIVLAMSSSAADNAVLSAGSSARVSLGIESGARNEALLTEIDSLVAEMLGLLDSGKAATDKDILRLLADIVDRMRAFGANVIYEKGSSVAPEFGQSYTEVLNAVWRAVHAVSREEMAQAALIAKMSSSASRAEKGKILQKNRIDILALGAQIAGRLVIVSQAARQAAEHSGITNYSQVDAGYHSVGLDEAISMLSTALFAVKEGLVEVRVVESVTRSLDGLLELKEGGPTLPRFSSSGVLDSLIVLQNAVQIEKTKSKFLKESGNDSTGSSSRGGGSSSQEESINSGIDDTSSPRAVDETSPIETVSPLQSAMSVLPIEELLRIERIIITLQRRIAFAARHNLSFEGEGYANTILGDIVAMFDGLFAAAASSSPDVVIESEMTTTSVGEVLSELDSDNLLKTSDAIVLAASKKGLPTTLSDAPFALLHVAATSILDLIQTSNGNLSLSEASQVQCASRIISALLRSSETRLLDMNSNSLIPCSEKRLSAVIHSLTASTDVVYLANSNIGKSWRTFATGLLSDAVKLDDTIVPTSRTSTTGKTSTTLAIASSACISSVQTALRLIGAFDAGSSTYIHTDLANKIALSFAVIVQGSAPLSDRSMALSASRAIARLSDAQSVGNIITPPLTPELLSKRSERISQLGSAGVFRALLHSCNKDAVSTHGTTSSASGPSSQPQILSPQETQLQTDFIKESLLTLATVGKLASSLYSSTSSVPIASQMGLDKRCLTAARSLLQSAPRRFPGHEESIIASTTSLISLLEIIFKEQSGSAFVTMAESGATAATTIANCQFQRMMTDTGDIYYISTEGEGTSQWEMPPIMENALNQLISMDVMTRSLEDEAVPKVSQSVVNGIVSGLEAHSHDPGIVGLLLGTLSKIAANPDNLSSIRNSNALQKAVTIVTEKNYINNIRICESIVALALPISFEPRLVKKLIGPSNVTPLLLAIADKYSNYTSPFAGSLISWIPDSLSKTYSDQISSIRFSGTSEAEEKNSDLPRVAQYCAQCIANLACDSEPDTKTGRSMVNELMEVNGGEGQGSVFEILGRFLRENSSNPRLLEDSICGLSNLAYFSDQCQLRIGRSCMLEVCKACKTFSHDAYLFTMTLRAVGNLTRADENIIRANGYGIVRGIVDGMEKHSDNVEALKLCADVLGNMASIDDKRMPRDESIQILKSCISETAAEGSVTMLEMVDQAETIKLAICRLIDSEGGSNAIVNAMLRHASRPELAASCLRALHYICASPDILTRMVTESRLANNVVYMMQANDTSEDVLKRGARILGGIAGVSTLVYTVIDAGAAPLLLSLVESMSSRREVSFLCVSVLTLIRGPAVTTSVRELDSATSLGVVFKNAVASNDTELYAVLLELFLAIAAEPDVALVISENIAQPLVQIFLKLANNGAHMSGSHDYLTLFSYILGILTAIARAGQYAAEPLIAAGVITGLNATIDLVVTAGTVGLNGREKNPQFLLQRDSRRAVVHSVSVFADLVRPPATGLGGNGASQTGVLCNSSAEHVLSEGGAVILEKALTAYRQIPDSSRPDALIFDANTCKAIVSVLQDLVLCGYKATVELTLDVPNNASSSSSTSAPLGSGNGGGGGNIVSTSKTRSQMSTESLSILTVLKKTPMACSQWTEKGSAIDATLTISEDHEWIITSTLDKAPPTEIPVDAVTKVLLGKKEYKINLFARRPHKHLGIVLEDSTSSSLLHIEFASEATRNLIAKTLGELANAEVRDIKKDKEVSK